MNLTQLQCLAVFAVFMLIGLGPVSISSLLGIYVVLTRPAWFWTLIVNLYRQRAPANPRHNPFAKTKALLSLVMLLVLDIAPVPVTASVGIVLILLRPLWFYRLVFSIYHPHRPL